MRDDEAVARFYEGWARQNSRLVEALRPLTGEQLGLRAAADKWPIWAIAGHTAGARVYWLCGVFKEGGAESTPFADASGFGWEDDPNTPRSAEELVFALESSWKIVERCLKRWTSSMLGDEYTRGTTQQHTRQSVLMRLITHEAYHAGEISQMLGVNGLPEIDLWRADRS
ncbi:MAG: DinB family protein [Chloroflexota bacterium]